jgi:hypothetical protein
MTDNDGTDGKYGGFVFDNDPSTETDRGWAGVDWTGDRRVVAAVLLVIAVVVLAAVVQPLVMSAVTSLLGGESGDTGNAVPGTPAGTAATAATSQTRSTEAATAGNPAATSPTTTISLLTSTSPTLTTRTPTPTPPAATLTPTPTRTPRPTATPTPAVTPTRTDSGTATAGDGTETGTRPATSGERSPRIEAFTVTDRSEEGIATLDAAWTVTDPDSNLAAVQVTLVADPAGEARTVERRRFDVSGAQSTGTTTFGVPKGEGMVYELRIEVTDAAGNTALSLTREGVDGSPDE